MYNVRSSDLMFNGININSNNSNSRRITKENLPELLGNRYKTPLRYNHHYSYENLDLLLTN